MFAPDTAVKKTGNETGDEAGKSWPNYASAVASDKIK